MNIKLLTILLALLTAVFETIGAIGSGIFWQSNGNRVWSVILILFGFGGSIGTYVFMRKFINDLALAQAFFIGGTALFALLVTFLSHRFLVRWEIVVGIMFIALGAILINRVLPE